MECGSGIYGENIIFYTKIDADWAVACFAGGLCIYLQPGCLSLGSYAEVL